MNYILETKRLVLRELTVEDADFILQLLNEPAYILFIGDRGVRTPAEARAYIEKNIRLSYKKNGFGLYLVEMKDDATPLGATPLGICGLINRDSLPDIDIGYAFLEAYRGNGYATESAQAVMAFGKTVVGLNRIVGITAVTNQPSINVLEKVGLHFEKLITLPGSDEEIMLFAWDSA